MWMMGYNEGGDFNMADSFNGRKLRPLMPRVPTVTATNHPTNCLRSIHGDNFIPLNHHHLGMSEPNKRDFNTQQLVVSSRWNPTPEQLQTLEELYRRGTRTPSAEQIQHITAQLRRYGKIEGKNVFYWFQNHKARERQKRRRQLESAAANGGGGGGDEQSRNNCNVENVESKDSGTGANRTSFEIEQTKNWPSPTNSSTTLAAEKSIATPKATAAAERWTVPFDEGRNATWQMMNLSCTATINIAPTSSTTPIISSIPSTPTSSTTNMEPKQFPKAFNNNDHHFNILITPFRTDDPHHRHHHHHKQMNIIENVHGDVGHGDSQTLELFPLRSNNDIINDEDNINHSDKDEVEISDVAATSNNNFTGSHYQFFEFLPLKN